MTSNTSIAILKKRIGLLLVLLWIICAGLYFFVPKLSKGNDEKAKSLAKSFTYAYRDLVYGKSAKNISYEVKNWKYEKEHYQITVKMEYPDSVDVLLNDSKQCKVITTYSFILDKTDKLVNFKRLDGNACAVKLEATEAARNALNDFNRFKSKMEEYDQKE